MLVHFIEIILIGITGFIFCDILIDRGMIFDQYGNFIERKFQKNYPKIYKVLGGCSLCFTGQLALWYFTLVYGFQLDVLLPLFTLIFGVSASIFTVYTINKIDDAI